MTAIEWTERTWNPTTGCDRTSPGCDHCYALKMAGRLKLMGSARYQTDGDPATSGPGFGVAVHPDVLQVPLRVKKPTTWFVNSMSDLFHPQVPDDFIEAVFSVMSIARQHTYQILTKRPQRMARLVPRLWWDCNGDVHLNRFTADELGTPDDQVAPATTPNVWLGTSVESDRYTFRADHLRATPAAIRFLSLEPLLGPLPSLDLAGIDWVIVGGESGPGARPMHPDWVRDIRDRCAAAGVAFFFKQWGSWMPYEPDGQPPFWNGQDGISIDGHYLPADLSEHEPTGGWWWPAWAAGSDDGDCVWRRGPKGRRVLDGQLWDEYPR